MLAPEPWGEHAATGIHNHYRRRGCVAGCGAGAAECECPPDRVLRLGPTSSHTGRVEALRTGLGELGYAEGKNIVIVS